MVSLKCHPDPTSESPVVMTSDSALIEKQDTKATQPVDLPANGHDTLYFIAEVSPPPNFHPFFFKSLNLFHVLGHKARIGSRHNHVCFWFGHGPSGSITYL